MLACCPCLLRHVSFDVSDTVKASKMKSQMGPYVTRDGHGVASAAAAATASRGRASEAP